MRHPSSSKNKKSNTSSSNTCDDNNNIGGINSNNTNTNTPCCSKVGLKRGPWTPEEDEVLANYIKKEGEGRWRTLPKRAGLLRCGKSCRLRWMNYLRPSVKRGHIAPDEEDLILRLHRLLGNRWSLIAGRIPGRTDNEIKNYWNTHLSKKLISQGIDPRTHKPLNPPINIPSSSSNKPPPIIVSNPSPRRDLANIVNQGAQVQVHGHHLSQHQQQRQHHHQVSNPYDHNHNVTSNPVVPATVTTEDVSVMGFMDNEECNDDVNINYYSDDVFSSFLNSLINDEAFAAQQHHAQTEIPGERSVPLPCDDPLVSATTASHAPEGYDDELGVLWESPLVPAATFSQNNVNVKDPVISNKRVFDHHNQ
ncbi:hypothetical protein Fmac_031712 [Flemingia macrophylla]|uniref:Uncharacterized protein n=1 Tax=Flemingia macrophylla TaxID=520843 RepID=A0ABD1L2X3_9FABA